MNWYKVFYWLTVADGVKGFFDTFSNIFTTFAVLTLIVYIILIGCRLDKTGGPISEDDKKSLNFWIRRFGTFFWISAITSLFLWAGYVFTPTKKDALIIIAGGAVGNFITHDTSARQLPAEVMNMLRAKVSAEIRDANMSEVLGDTLKNKTKEELMEIIKTKKD